jgi:hypothetical protein
MDTDFTVADKANQTGQLKSLPEISGAENLGSAMKLPLTIAMSLLAFHLAVGAEAKPPAKSFETFWTEFKAAVTSNNKEAIAGLTKLPFGYAAKGLNRAEFIKECSVLFDGKTRACFRNAKPVKADDRDSYSVFCGETIFIFARARGEYRFTEIGVND